jgi:DNA modification methylase
MTHLGPYPLDSIITGDARELAKAIPDESVDLIFTDPVYDRIDDYRWLAKTAARVLKPDTSLLTFCGIGYLDKTLEALSGSGLTWRWLLTANYAMRKQFHGRLQVSMTTCLWMQKGKGKMYGSVGDSTTLPHERVARYVQSNGASWDKHPKIMRRYILGFCPPDGAVVDFFTGLGSTAAYCKQLGCHWLGFEIDSDTAERARQRVLTTQAPLVFPQPEQLDLLP